jgi:hypothetical protein
MTELWSEWQGFPDPRKGGMLTAPFGAGCYELRDRSNGKLVLFGKGSSVAFRMISLLPKPFGRGTRNNLAKRAHVFEHIADIEYRTLACATPQEAELCERKLKANKSGYIFGT